MTDMKKVWAGGCKRLLAIMAGLGLCASVQAGPFDAWSSKMKVTFNYNEFQPLTNFPALVVLSPSLPGFSYSQFSSPTGADLRFTDENGNEIPYEIEKWNPSGSSYVWVRVPKLIGRGNTNFFDGQWLSDWSWNGQTVRARRHSNNQLFAEKVEANGIMAAWTFKPQRYPDGAPGFDAGPISFFREFALGDPRTGWVWPHPILYSFTPDTLVATLTNYWENPVTYEHAIVRQNNGYYWLQSQESGRLIWSGEAAQAKSDFMSSYSTAERCAQAALFMDFNPNDPHNPAWAGNYTNQTTYIGNNSRASLTYVTAYWGSSSATMPAYTTNGSVWSANYVGVWHLGQTNAKDSTRRIADGTATSAGITAGKAGDAVSFTGSSKIDFGTANIGFSGHTAFSVEAWVKRTSTGNGPDVSYGNTGAGSSFSIGTDGSGNYRNIHHFSSSDRTYGRSYANGQWEHVVFNYYPCNGDSTSDFSEHLYINGEWVGTSGRDGSDLANVPSSAPLKFGQESWGSSYCGNLVLDEVRISKKVRMYNWQRASFLTMASNAAFTTYATVQSTTPVEVPTNWVAYNDIAWNADETANNLTMINPVSGSTTSGALIDYGTGTVLPVGLSFAVNGAAPALADLPDTNPNMGSDAYAIFNGKVNCKSRVYWTAGSVSMTLSGLSSSNLYSVVLYGSRGNASYTDRTTAITISDAVGFANNSSAGSILSTSGAANDTTTIVTGDNLAGRVFRYDNISAGTDGNVVFTMTGANTPYINAMMVSLGAPVTNQPPVTNPPPVETNWVAYNDCVVNSGEPTANISTLAAGVSGSLVDSATGATLPAQVTMSIVGGSVSTTTDAPAPVGGSDAANVLGGSVGLAGCNTLGQGTLSIGVSGLNTAKRYSFVLYASRGYSTYTYRWQSVKLEGAASFLNNSSSGSTITTTDAANDTTKILSANTEGRIFRYDNIAPGVGGTFTIKVAGGADAGSTTNGYINAFMVGTYVASTNAGDADVDGMPDSWEQQYFGGTTVQPGADADGDGISNIEEYVSGCNPQSAGSLPTMNVTLPSSNLLSFAMQTVTGRVYSVYSRTNMIGGAWTFVTNMTGNGGEQSFNTAPGNGKAYYHFKVKLQ